MAEGVVNSTVFTSGVVRVLGELREIQSLKHMPHKHEDYGSQACGVCS